MFGYKWLPKDKFNELIEERDTWFAKFHSLLDDVEMRSLKENNMSGAQVYSNSESDAEFNHRVYQHKAGEKNRHIVYNSKHKTFEEAVEFAKILAAQYPANTYSVSSITAVVKADIPVVVTKVPVSETES